MTDDEKAQWRAWMDRAPPSHFGGIGLVGAALLRHRPWRDWFDGDVCLAAMSARTGPDVTTVAAKRCGCVQCTGEGE